MDAIDLLTQQHDEVEDLFDQIESSEGREREPIARVLADKLAAHAMIEEKLFYPAVYDTDDEEERERYTEAMDEHRAMKDLADELVEMAGDDTGFGAKLGNLRDLVEEHVAEEESVLFDAARAQLDERELESLGDEMEKQFDREIEQEPRVKVPRQPKRAARPE